MSSEPGNEQIKQKEHYERFNRIPDDSFVESYIKYNSFLLLGYPMEFRPDNTDSDSGPILAVYIDPSKTEVIKMLQYQVHLDGITRILDDIDLGRAHRLAKLLKGEEEDYYAFTPQSPTGSNPAGKYRCDLETLRRCYMRAYERYFERVKAGTMYFEKMGRSYGPFTATPDSLDTELYNECQKDQLSPITSDELIEMTKQVVEMILERSPELKPF